MATQDSLRSTPSAPAPKEEERSSDQYRGSAAELVATGLVELHQLPGQPGRPSQVVYYHCGEQAERIRRIDHQPDPENWMRIRRLDDDEYSMCVGIPRDQMLLRRKEAAEARKREWAKYEAEMKQQEAVRGRGDADKLRRDAEHVLDTMPESRDDYLSAFIDKLRWSLNFECRYETPEYDRKRFHGYMLTAESAEAIQLAFDAVVEAVLEAEVTFDKTLHQQVKTHYQQQLASLDSRFQEQLKVLATPNEKLLERSLP